MAITTTENGGMMITGEHIAIFDLLRIQKALKLEVKTGMTMSRGVSMVKVAQDRVTNVLGSKKKLPRTKAKALEAYTQLLNDHGIECE